MVMGRAMGVGGTAVTLAEIGHVIQEGSNAVKLGKVAKPFDWFPVKSIEYNPSRDTLRE